MVEWSYPVKGDLALYPNEARFENWVIPRAQVIDAALNTERLLFKKRQSLLVDCGESKYMFGLYNSIDSDIEFPFQVRVTEKRSFVGKLILFGVVIFLINISWQILGKFI